MRGEETDFLPLASIMFPMKQKARAKASHEDGRFTELKAWRKGERNSEKGRRNESVSGLGTHGYLEVEKVNP